MFKLPTRNFAILLFFILVAILQAHELAHRYYFGVKANQAFAVVTFGDSIKVNSSVYECDSAVCGYSQGMGYSSYKGVFKKSEDHRIYKVTLRLYDSFYRLHRDSLAHFSLVNVDSFGILFVKQGVYAGKIDSLGFSSRYFFE